MKPRVRYRHLKTCLDKLADAALNAGATVHMPRIGCGEGGGEWLVVEDIVDEALCRRNIPVTVYDLPSSKEKKTPEQTSLFVR